MKRDAVLKRSRKEKPDEGKEDTDNKAFIYGMVTVVFISFILIAWNDFHDKAYGDISSIICSALTVGLLVKYNGSKKIGYLIVGIVAAIVTIASLFLYFVYGV